MARAALQNAQQELATKEVEQWVRSELENTDLREKLDILGRSTKGEDNQEPRKQGLKLNVILGKTFVMTREGTKITSIISVAGRQVAKNLSAVRDHVSTSGHLGGLPETERPQTGF